MDILQLLEMASSVVGVAAIVASFFPTPAHPALQMAKKVIDTAAFNINHAKNKQ